MTSDVSSIVEYWRRELPRVEGFPAPLFADKIKETIAVLEAMSGEPVAWRGKHMHPAATEWVYVDGPTHPAAKFGSLIQLQPLYHHPAVTLAGSGAAASQADGTQELLAGEALLAALAERLEQSEGEPGMIADCDDCLAIAAAIRAQAAELAKTKTMLAECFNIGVDYLTATKDAEADRDAQAQMVREMTLLLLQTSRYAPDAQKDRVAGYVKRRGLSSPFRVQADADGGEGGEEDVQPVEAANSLPSDDVLIAAMLAIEEGEHQYGWFAKWRDSMDEWKGEHFGDCTKAPISCLRCAYDEAMKRLPEFKRILADLGPGTRDAKATVEQS